MDLFQSDPESWHDYCIDKIIIDGENVIVHLEDEGKLTIKCCECIFLSIVHWEESILKAIRINEKAPVIDKTLQMIRKSYGDDYLGGGTKSLSEKYYQIVFEYLDGNIFEVVCKDHIIVTGWSNEYC